MQPREHITFLRAVHLSEKTLYDRSADLDYAIGVYRNIWLPSFDTANVKIPSLDVAWVWHLHKLDPISYHRDCLRWIGRLIDVRKGISPFCFEDRPLTSDQPQILDFGGGDAEFIEIISDRARRQSTLLWQLRWPEYEDPTFLDESVERYRLMLGLMRLHPEQFIVPTYDIDNIWHTHLAFPQNYLELCHCLVGRHVGHDDSVNDRAEGSKLRVCTAATERLWNQAFSCPWRKQGGMYRGEPPSWYWGNRRRAAGSMPAHERHGLLGTRAVEVLGFAFGTTREARKPTSAFVCPRYAC